MRAQVIRRSKLSSCYSFRNATAGSTRAARRAGSMIAREDAANSNTATPMVTRGSFAWISYRTLASTFPNAKAIDNPIARPDDHRQSTLSRDKQKDVSRFCADRHPDPELRRSLRHQLRQHTV